MELTVGSILEGKVKSITNFGAFISLPENKTGLVHISEVANTYVSDIRQHLTEGQDVKVMVISAENGKINLSIKRLEPKPQREGGRDNNFRSGDRPNFQPRRDFNRDGGRDFNRDGNRSFNRDGSREGGREGGYQNRSFNRDGNHQGGYQHRQSRPAAAPAAPKTADQLFEERLKQFMSESDSKISSIRQYSEHRTKNSRRK